MSAAVGFGLPFGIAGMSIHLRLRYDRTNSGVYSLANEQERLGDFYTNFAIPYCPAGRLTGKVDNVGWKRMDTMYLSRIIYTLPLSRLSLKSLLSHNWCISCVVEAYTE